MRPGARITAAIELLEQVHASWAQQKRIPADSMMADYFKNRRFMGSKDRGFVSELVYFVLRNGGSLQWWLEQSNYADITPRQIILVALLFKFNQSPADIQALCDGKEYSPAKLSQAEKDLLNGCADEELLHPQMPEWARYNLPGWLIQALKREYPNSFESEIIAMNTEAPIDLRVNTLKCADRSDLIMELDRSGHYGMPTPYSSLGVRLKKRLPVFTLDAFRNGWFEMQDEGSQLVAELVNAEPGQKVIDFCAGAGGKTLALAAKMENKGRILAWDINETRLNQIKKRLTRAGVDNVILHVIKSEQDSFIKRHKDSADWVLVDAPCSGSGTIRRNPDLKWRLEPEDIRELQSLQARILDSAAKLVMPGGYLVYATCSMLPDENQRQIEAFLERHVDYRPEPLPEKWQDQTSPNPRTYLQLTPHQHHTDGFFASILRRL